MSTYQYNLQQNAAITYPMKSLLVLAGAGTGKTTTIVGRIAHLIQNEKVSLESILALTFTNDAANHLKIKLAHEIGEKAHGINACTFHAFAQLFTMKNYIELGYSRHPRLMNEGDIYYLIRNRFDELGEMRSRIFRRDHLKAVMVFKKIFEGFNHNLLTDLERKSFKRDELESLKLLDDEREMERINQLIDVVEVFPYYQKWKKEEDYVDYGDLIINLWDLISRDGKVCKDLQKQYQHVIVDEFQDNNYALSEIVKKIADPENSIMVVGDDDQCIYAFRQANIQNIYQFKKYYQINDREHITLSNNYRSNQQILDLANSVIDQNSERLNNKKLIGIKKGNEKPKLLIGSENQQLLKMIQMIKILIEKGEDSENIAILLRSHRKCRLVSNTLIESGIQTSYYHERLFEKSVIKDIIALLNIWAFTNKMEHSFLRIIKKFIGIEKMMELTLLYDNEETDISLIDYAMMQDGIVGSNACRIMKKIRSIKTNNVLELVWEILKIDKFYYSHNDTLEAIKTCEIINQFRELADNYHTIYLNKRIEEFVDFVNIQFIINDVFLDSSETRNRTSGVKIMTVHGAKGLEFNHVFIPFLRSNIFPTPYKRMEMIDRLPISWQRWSAGEKSEKDLHLEEERRLFYVAITRAMESLTLLGPSRYKSTFIKELDEENIIIEQIMDKEERLEMHEKLKGKYNVELKNELELQHFGRAREIIDILENITQLSKGNKVDWDNDELKKEMKFVIDEKVFTKTLSNLVLSASSAEIYDKCPLQYKYKYINKIQGRSNNPYIELGKIIHLVIDKFHENKDYSLKVLINLLNDNWNINSLKFKQEERQWRQDAENMLKNYWNYFSSNLLTNNITEYSFTLERKFGELNGRCDFIGVDDNDNIIIADYKSSKNTKSEGQLRNDIQLGVYALFMLKKGINMNGKIFKGLPSKLSMLYLREESPEVSVLFSEEDIDLIGKKIDDVGMKIQKGIFNSCKGRYCDWCDYREFLCPEFN